MSPAARRRAAAIPLDLRDPRLPGGRLSLSSGTADAASLERYRRAVLAVLGLECGPEVVRRLKLTKRQPGKIALRELADAVSAMNLPALLERVRSEGEGVAAELPRAMLGRMVDRFLEKAASDLRPKTLRAYTTFARALEAAFGVVRAGADGPVVRDVAVASILSTAGQKWLKENKSTGRPWAPRTQKLAHTVARQVWDAAAGDEQERAEKEGREAPALRNFWQLDRARRALSIRPARIRKTRVVFLSRPQAAKLLRANRGTHRAAWVAAGIYGSLRIGERTNLRTRADVDLKKGELRIHPREGEHAWRPKSDASVREVPVSRRLGRWMRAHVRMSYAGERYFFHTPGQDRPFSETTAGKWTGAAFRAAGLPFGRQADSMTDHTLRHTFCTWAMQAGENPADIAYIAGDSVEMIVATYLHHAPSNRRRVVESAARGARR